MATDGRSASRAAADARRMTREGDRDLTRVIVAGATCAISACALTTLYWRAVYSSSSNSSSRSVGGVNASGRDDADEPRSHDATSARKKRRAKKKAAAAAGGSEESRLTKMVRMVDVCAVLEQQTHCCRMAHL